MAIGQRQSGPLGGGERDKGGVRWEGNPGQVGAGDLLELGHRTLGCEAALQVPTRPVSPCQARLPEKRT